MLPNFQLEQEIIKEMRDWSSHTLEKINPNYNDLPACPYAKTAWAQDRVGFCFKYNDHWQDLYTLVSQWDDSKDVVILIDFCPLPIDEMDSHLNMLNDMISAGMLINRDMFLMGFHPDDVDNDFLDDSAFESEISTSDVSYAMIFLQRLTKLQEASDALRVKGYYKNCEEYYDSEQLYENRRFLYRRLKDEEKGKEDDARRCG